MGVQCIYDTGGEHQKCFSQYLCTALVWRCMLPYSAEVTARTPLIYETILDRVSFLNLHCCHHQKRPSFSAVF